MINEGTGSLWNDLNNKYSKNQLLFINININVNIKIIYDRPTLVKNVSWSQFLTS